jgi:DNA-binding transcriptional ArsR family regulator
MDEFQPAELFMIKDLETAKAIADPLRLQILEVLIPAPLTVKQMAEKLGLGASKLYYHVNTLEKHGLVQVVETQVHGNLIEKRYWVTAYNYSVEQEIYNFDVQEQEGQENIIASVLTTLDTVREDFARSIEARAYNLEHGAEPHPRHVIKWRVICRVPDERMEAFQARLHELLDEFEALDEPANVGLQSWAFTVLLYPTFYYEQTGSGEAD